MSKTSNALEWGKLVFALMNKLADILMQAYEEGNTKEIKRISQIFPESKAEIIFLANKRKLEMKAEEITNQSNS